MVAAPCVKPGHRPESGLSSWAGYMACLTSARGRQATMNDADGDVHHADEGEQDQRDEGEV